MPSDSLWMISQGHWGHPQLDVNHLKMQARHRCLKKLILSLRYLCKSHWSDPFLPRGGAAEWAQRSPVQICGRHTHLNSADITAHKFYLITLPFKTSSLLRGLQPFTWGFTQESCSVSWKSWIIKMASHTVPLSLRMQHYFRCTYLGCELWFHHTICLTDKLW